MPATLDAERHVREDVPPEVLDAHRRDRGAAASAWQRADADNLDGAGVRAFVATFSQRLSSPRHARELGTQLGAHSRMRGVSRRGAARRTEICLHRGKSSMLNVVDLERASARRWLRRGSPRGLKKQSYPSCRCGKAQGLLLAR